MKYIITLTIAIMAMTMASAQEIDKLALRMAVEKQMNDYPESTLQDVYKAFYQEHFGSEHMISDTVAVRNYLNYELETMGDDFGGIFYEPIGLNGDYVRVSLGTVKVGLITADEILKAFIDSSNSPRSTTIEWAELWSMIVDVVDDIKPGFGAQERELLRQASLDNKAVHHSSAYRAAYNPHYRIVERTIFEMLLKENIDR